MWQTSFSSVSIEPVAASLVSRIRRHRASACSRDVMTRSAEATESNPAAPLYRLRALAAAERDSRHPRGGAKADGTRPRAASGFLLTGSISHLSAMRFMRNCLHGSQKSDRVRGFKVRFPVRTLRAASIRSMAASSNRKLRCVFAGFRCCGAPRRP